MRIHDLIASQRPHLLILSPWELGFETGIWEEHRPSDLGTYNQCHAGSGDGEVDKLRFPGRASHCLLCSVAMCKALGSTHETGHAKECPRLQGQLRLYGI
jgi:hypothetical protein